MTTWKPIELNKHFQLLIKNFLGFFYFGAVVAMPVQKLSRHKPFFSLFVWLYSKLGPKRGHIKIEKLKEDT